MKLVEVTWDDAHSHGISAWTSYDADAKAIIARPFVCHTVGYLLPETNKHVVAIAASIGTDTNDGVTVEQISGHMTIPRGMIRKIRVLK